MITPTFVEDQNTPATTEPSVSANFGHLVILIHGINTRALWMDAVAPALRADGFFVAPISYGEFSVVRFLSFPYCRRAALERVDSGFDTAIEVFRKKRGAFPEKISVISHSFGTWLLLKFLSTKPHIKLFKLIVCGSVVREDFNFDPILHKFEIPLLNEIGTKDYWPAIAESAGWGYGSLGSTGIHHPAAENRWHLGFQHSSFLTESFCKRFWIPFLSDSNEIVEADPACALPLSIRVISGLPLRWIILLGGVGILFSTLNILVGYLGGANVQTISCGIAYKYFFNFWLSLC